MPTGSADLDAALGGGLRPATVHEVWSANGGASATSAAASGFALALAAALVAPTRGTRNADRETPRGAEGRSPDREAKNLLWVWPKRFAQEAGLPYGPGLMAFGHDPGRILLVEAANGLDVLWTVEEALTAPLAAVIAFVDDAYEARAFTASRRFALAARAHGTSAFVIGTGRDGFTSAAPLRWQVTPLPADASHPTGHPTGETGTIDPSPRSDPSPRPGRSRFASAPRWQVGLARNRFGATGHFDLTWDHHAASLSGNKLSGMGAADIPDGIPGGEGQPAVNLRFSSR